MFDHSGPATFCCFEGPHNSPQMLLLKGLALWPSLRPVCQPSAECPPGSPLGGAKWASSNPRSPVVSFKAIQLQLSSFRITVVTKCCCVFSYICCRFYCVFDILEKSCPQICNLFLGKKINFEVVMKKPSYIVAFIFLS